jgi:hypothetical protein
MEHDDGGTRAAQAGFRCPVRRSPPPWPASGPSSPSSHRTRSPCAASSSAGVVGPVPEVLASYRATVSTMTRDRTVLPPIVLPGHCQAPVRA